MNKSKYPKVSYVLISQNKMIIMGSVNAPQKEELLRNYL